MAFKEHSQYLSNVFMCLQNKDLTKGWASSEYSEVFDARLEQWLVEPSSMTLFSEKVSLQLMPLRKEIDWDKSSKVGMPAILHFSGKEGNFIDIYIIN